jgi:hypothetical protein
MSIAWRTLRVIPLESALTRADRLYPDIIRTFPFRSLLAPRATGYRWLPTVEFPKATCLGQQSTLEALTTALTTVVIFQSVPLGTDSAAVGVGRPTLAWRG